ncbi:MAG: tetratricopeptide repeat protein [Asticcacaulis sp.]
MGEHALLKGSVAAVLVFGLMCGRPAMADEVLHYGAAPAWVVPVAAPKSPPPNADAPLRVLLFNSQTNMANDADSYYSETLIQVQTPEGLDVGQKTIVWNPQTQTVTIHKLQIIRDGEVIDLLAKGLTFTILRRENNLEISMLDGRLTGVAQPEDIRVGDMIAYAFTLKETDPILKGHSEGFMYNGASVPVDRLYLRAEWPKSKPITYRLSPDFTDAKLSQPKDKQSLLIDRTNATVPEAPKYAPPRYGRFSQVQFSQFAGWDAVSGLMAPYYVHELTPGSPLAAEVETLRKLPDQKAQAFAALKLVQDQVRYVFIGLNQGGYVPAKADETWTRRFGDCKAKTVLLLTLLKALGIEAEAVLVATSGGDGLNERLPAVGLFDHVMVRATIDGKVYWLDGTRSGDRALDRLPVPEVSWALPVRATGAELIRVDVPPLTEPSWDYNLVIDATGGLDVDAPVDGEIIIRGDEAITTRQNTRSLTPSERDKTLRKYWKDEYSFIEPTTVSLSFDEATGDAHLKMTGKAKMDWRYNSQRAARRYETDGYSLGWKSDLEREDGINKDAPVTLNYPYYTRNRETIRLPYEGKGFVLDGENVDTTLGGRHFKREVRLDKGVFMLDSSTRSLQPEQPLAEALSSAKPIEELLDKDVYLVAPQNYAKTTAEIAAIRANTPKTAEEYLQRGWKLFTDDHLNDALADFEAGLKLDPKSGPLMTSRGAALLSLKRFDEAEKDFEQALKINPYDWGAMRGMSMIYSERKQYRQAADLLVRVSEASPGDTTVLNMLAEAYSDDGQYEAAARTLRKIIALEPDNAEAYGDLGDALSYCGDVKGEACDAQLAEAVKAYDRSLELEPNAWNYSARMNARPKSQREARFADIEAAIKLQPKSLYLQRLKAALYVEYDDYAAALKVMDQAVELDPKDAMSYVLRGDIHAKMKNNDLSLKDVETAKTLSPDNAGVFNDACWFRATRNLELDKAKADCAQALKLAPKDAAIMDSSAFVELRLGNFAEAIRLYDEAIRIRPNQADSLFGRGIAKLRTGDTTGGQKDIEAARAADKDIEATYKDYGVTP